jgi:hypothetical protein
MCVYVCVFLLSFCSAGDQIQGFMYAWQVLCLWAISIFIFSNRFIVISHDGAIFHFSSD